MFGWMRKWSATFRPRPDYSDNQIRPMMKAILFSFSLSFTLFVCACQPKDSQVATTSSGERWKLVEVRYASMIAGQSDKSVPLPYEEMLELKSDRTFSRQRSTGYAATGTYAVKRYAPDDYGILATFDDKTLSYHELPDFRQHSFTEGQVYFRQLEPNVLVESYVAADGPAFYYHRVQGEE